MILLQVPGDKLNLKKISFRYISFCIWIIVLAGCGGKKGKATEKYPEENRLKRTTISENTNPVAFDISEEGNIYLIESNGYLKIIDPKTKTSRTAGVLKVFDPGEYGLIGVALDPGFMKNHWIYFQYGSPREKRDSAIFQISRFTVHADSLDLGSEKKLFQVPHVYACCHSGGGMDFDSKGNLYIATGDNTDAFQTLYSPSDERKGHEIANALRSAGNSRDLRGKILRIHPEEDGTYTIPTDNLFADGKDGRSEIYIMGCRNPFRIFIDRTTDILYWGEVGPDAEKDSSRGPRGYDEFNIAKKAGFYGWPLFIGNNKPYKRINFETGEILSTSDIAHPNNYSVLNSGIRDLPPPQAATIWYPYDQSPDFPSFGTGGRTAVGGPIYHFNPDSDAKNKLPEYFDGCWFIADWMRNWIKVVHFNSEEKISGIDSFMSSSVFKKPIYMRFGGDGNLYVIEYGSNWFDNLDSRLVKIEYVSGNRSPLAEIAADKEYEALPFQVALSGKTSSDPDNDTLRYQWTLSDGKIISEKAAFTYTIETPGKQTIVLTVTDPDGLKNSKSITVYAGNSKPQVKINLLNDQFYWESNPYSVVVSDAEDGVLGKQILPDQVRVELSEMPRNIIVSGNNGEEVFQRGEVLMNENDCRGCHSMHEKSVGPSFEMVSKKYAYNDSNISRLAEKVLSGGNGVWGNQAMAAHPQLNKTQTVAIVQYILSLNKEKKIDRKLKTHGDIRFPSKPMSVDNEKSYLLSASYDDKGGKEIGSLNGTAKYLLRYPRFYAGDFDGLIESKIVDNKLLARTDAYARLSHIDLSNIKQIVLKASGNGIIEIRLDGMSGTLLGTAKVNSGDSLKIVPVNISEYHGRRDIYFIRKNSDLRFKEYAIEWVYFSNTLQQP